HAGPSTGGASSHAPVRPRAVLDLKSGAGEARGMNKTVADLIQERFGLPSRAGHDMPAEGTVAQILSHRTHRRYKPNPVPDDVLEIVLAAALSAPSKSDLQQVAIVLVNDRAKQATLAGWIPDLP